ncbi:MAG: DUF5985 family protein [Betaproteobacteria bacterium]
MASLVYALCMLTSFACAWLLMRSYIATRHRLLLWSGLCFVGLAVTNLLLVLDFVVFPEVDISPWRSAITMLSILLLLFGLIWEDK